MSENISVNTRRVKYKSTWAVFTMHTSDKGLVHLDVDVPLSNVDKKCFSKIAETISKLVYSGVRDRMSIVGKLDRLPNMDADILNFMKKVTREVLPLS